MVNLQLFIIYLLISLSLILFHTFSYIRIFLLRAQSFAERLRLGLAVIHGDQLESDSEIVDGRHSPPPERSRRISSMYSEVASELIPPGNFVLKIT